MRIFESFICIAQIRVSIEMQYAEVLVSITQLADQSQRTAVVASDQANDFALI